jgi:hypothetical protein
MIQKTNLKKPPFCRQAVGLQENFFLFFSSSGEKIDPKKINRPRSAGLDQGSNAAPEPTFLVAFAAHAIPPTHESTPDRRLHSALVHGFNSFIAGACCIAVQATRFRFPQLRDLRRPHWFIRFWTARYHPLPFIFYLIIFYLK